MEKRVALILVGSQRRPPGFVEGAGDVAWLGKGDGVREGGLKSMPRVKERADWVGREPVGEEQ